MRLQIDTYEDRSPTPILSHVFYGNTRDDIQAIIDAHALTDSFFQAALTTGLFRGMILSNRYQWSA